MEILILIAFTATILLLLFLLSPVFRHIWFARHLPGPIALPLIGNIFQIICSQDEVYNKVESFSAGCDSICRMWIFHKLLILIKNPNAVKMLMNNKSSMERSFFYDFLGEYLGNGILTAPSQLALKTKKDLLPLYSTRSLTAYMKYFNRGASQLCAMLNKKIGPETFKIHEICTPVIIEHVLRIMFEDEIDSWASDDFSSVKEMVDFSSMVISERLHSLKYNSIIYNMSRNTRKMIKKYSIFRETFRKLIHKKKMKMAEERRTVVKATEEQNNEDSSLEPRKGYVEVLLKFVEKNQGFDDEFIIDNIITLALGAYDTVSSTVSYILVLLAMHPEIQNRVYEEQFQIFGSSDRPVEYEDLNQMTYLEQVIKETIRLFPAVPAVGREITEDLEIDGYRLPKGAFCLVSIANVHRDSRYWINPHSFNPDNFAPDLPPNPAYFGFSSGPRMCIGHKYAIINLKTFTSQVVRRFHLTTSLKETDLKLIFNVILGADYLTLNVHPRN